MDRWTDERLDETVASLRRDVSRYEAVSEQMRSIASDFRQFKVEVDGRLQAVEATAARAESDSDDTKRLLFTVVMALLTAALGLCAALIGVAVL